MDGCALLPLASTETGEPSFHRAADGRDAQLYIIGLALVILVYMHIMYGVPCNCTSGWPLMSGLFMTGKLTFMNNIRFTEEMTSFFLADFKARWVALCA